jgi:Tol biopolymer transport system component
MTRALNSRSHRRGCGRKVVPNRSRFCKLFLLACLVSVAVIRPSPVFAGSFSFTPLQWSPDGQRLVTIIRIGKVPQSLSERLSPKHKQARYEIWLLRSDGSRLRKVSQQPDFPQWVGNEHLLLGRETLPTEGDLKWDLVDLRGERVARIVSEAPELLAWEVSPDGRYLAYVGDWPQKEPFQCAVFLYQFSDRRTVGRYSIDNYAWNISWSPDSRYLYIAGEWRLDVANARLEHKDKERVSIGGFNDRSDGGGGWTWPRLCGLADR